MGCASEDVGLKGEGRWYFASTMLLVVSFFMVIITFSNIPLSLWLLIPDAPLFASGCLAFRRWQRIVGAGERPSGKWGARYALGIALLYVGLFLFSIGTTAGFGTPLWLLSGVVGLPAMVSAIVLTVKYRRAYGYWAAHGLPPYKYYKYSVNLPQSVVENFRRIDPDQVFETKEFVAVMKRGIYAFLAKRRPAVYFIKPKQLTPAPDAKKPNLPFLGFRAPHFKYQVNGIPLARLKGSVTIPVGAVKRGDGTTEEKYAEGPAVVYVLSRMEAPRRPAHIGPPSDLSALLDNETIERIIRSLLKQSI